MMESKDNIIPHENDILLGRGGKNNRHVGNEKLRTLAKTYVDAYIRSTKKGKSNISWDLVQAVRSMKPPGRFLKRASVAGSWQDVGDEAAREKTSQAMRDAIAIAGSVHTHSFGQEHYGLDPQSARQPRGPSRTVTFPTCESWGSTAAYPHWHASSQAYSHPPMYSSPKNSRHRSSTIDSALVSPENISRSFPGVSHGSLHLPKRSVSFSEYTPMEVSSYSHQQHQHQHRWAPFPPQSQYPLLRQRLCEDKMMELDMRPLNSWDDDDDDDLHNLPVLNGFDYTVSSSQQIDGEQRDPLFPNAKESQPWNNPSLASSS